MRKLLLIGFIIYFSFFGVWFCPQRNAQAFVPFVLAAEAVPYVVGGLVAAGVVVATSDAGAILADEWAKSATASQLAAVNYMVQNAAVVGGQHLATVANEVWDSIKGWVASQLAGDTTYYASIEGALTSSGNYAEYSAQTAEGWSKLVCPSADRYWVGSHIFSGGITTLYLHEYCLSTGVLRSTISSRDNYDLVNMGLHMTMIYASNKPSVCWACEDGSFGGWGILSTSSSYSNVFATAAVAYAASAVVSESSYVDTYDIPYTNGQRKIVVPVDPTNLTVEDVIPEGATYIPDSPPVDVPTDEVGWLGALGSILSQIANLLNPASDTFFLKTAFVPAEGYFQTTFQDIRIAWLDKMGDGIFQKTFGWYEIEPNFSVTIGGSVLPQHTFDIVDADVITGFRDKLRFWLGGIMGFLTFLFCVKKVPQIVRG